MTIRERILKYLDYKAISKYKFYRITGISNGFLDKNGAIGSDKCEIICSHFTDLSPEWLLTRTGSMIKKDRFDLVSDDGLAINSGKNESVSLLIEKIVELTTEIAILKTENIKLKLDSVGTARVKAYPIKDQSLLNDIVAEPSDDDCEKVS